jgi:hypothetical protein
MSDFDATESEATKANAALIRSGYEAFARGDVAGALAVFADDILWHVPGRGPLSGDDRGHAQVLEFFGHFMRLSAHSGFSSMRFWQGGPGRRAVHGERPAQWPPLVIAASPRLDREGWRRRGVLAVPGGPAERGRVLVPACMSRLEAYRWFWDSAPSRTVR